MRPLLLLALFSSVVAPAQAQSPTPHLQAKGVLSVPQAERALSTSSQRVARALWRNDTRTLASYIHPQQGVRFSPYVFLDMKDARKWSQQEVARLGQSKIRYDWGQYDAGEERIHKTWNAFRREFLSPRDFSKAQVTFQSKRSHGNTINNLRTVYPDSALVEFYLPGTSKYGGMDWNGLWLVWRQAKSHWYLVAIVGDRWTT